MLSFKNNLRYAWRFAARHPIPTIFVLFCVLGLKLSGLSFSFVSGEVLTRLARDTVLALALVVPIAAGMGINFALPVGAIAAQIAVLSSVCMGLEGYVAVAAMIGIAVPLAALLGWGIGLVLNRVPGREMIVSIVLGVLASNIYQLLCLGVPGRLVPVADTAVLLSKGSGLRNSVDLGIFKHMLKNIWEIDLCGVAIPLGALLVVGLFAGFVHFLLRTRFGLHARAVAGDRDRAALCGIAPSSVRILAMIISTVLGACGQLIYLQDLSILNVYTGHLLSDIFAGAALFAGGATLRRATVGQVLFGIILFHTLFVVSPMAGQNTFSNSALGEYFRSFVAYGSIALAIVLNRREDAGRRTVPSCR